MRYCGKCGRARQATDDNTVWRMRLACWKFKATDKHSEYEIRIVFNTASIVAQTLLIFTLCIHCLSCFLYNVNINFRPVFGYAVPQNKHHTL